MERLSSLKPQKVFEYFEEICKIPHGSGNCTAISDFIIEFAKQRNLECSKDECQNVLVRVPASAGYEKFGTVILQGHMDMVCEKEANVEFDFSRDAIRPYIDGDFIKAEGTTLGGDNGIAIAMMLAIMDDKTIKHPELELLMTVDEETSMAGAFGFDCSCLHGHHLINLDSEYEGILMCSCAGGVDAVCELPMIREDATGYEVKIKVSGLRGGHSGVEIDKGRANANVLMARILCDLQKEISFRILSYYGGSRVNAISPSAEVTMLIAESDLDLLKEKLDKMQTLFAGEYHAADPEISLDVEALGEGTHSVLDETSTKKMISLLISMPDGVQEMSLEMAGLVQTSCNIGAAELQESSFAFTSSIRSCIESKKLALAEKITNVVELAGGKASLEEDYPGWDYNPNSLLKDTLIAAYRKVCGIEASVEAVHAGIECGIFAAGIPDLDCISIGPTMADVHTPQEHLSISSVQRTWDVLLTALEDAKYE